METSFLRGSLNWALERTSREGDSWGKVGVCRGFPAGRGARRVRKLRPESHPGEP